MEENKELQSLMERIDASNQKQAKYAKWQCIFSAAAAICCAAVLIILVCLLPKANSLAGQLESVIANVQQVTSQLAQADWEGLISDLELVSQQMADANLGGIAQDVSGLVQSSQTGLEEALGKIKAIDLETLNKAIQDLSDVVAPLARLVNKF